MTRPAQWDTSDVGARVAATVRKVSQLFAQHLAMQEVADLEIAAARAERSPAVRPASQAPAPSVPPNEERVPGSPGQATSEEHATTLDGAPKGLNMPSGASRPVAEARSDPAAVPPEKQQADLHPEEIPVSKLTVQQQYINAEQAHVFQGMVQGFNVATGTEMVAVTGTSAFVIENQAGVPFARIRREDVTGSEVLYQWLESVKGVLLMGHVVQVVRKATPEEEAQISAVSAESSVSTEAQREALWRYLLNEYGMAVRAHERARGDEDAEDAARSRIYAARNDLLAALRGSGTPSSTREEK